MSKTFWSGPVTKVVASGTLAASNTQFVGPLPVFPEDAWTVVLNGQTLVSSSDNPAAYHYFMLLYNPTDMYIIWNTTVNVGDVLSASIEKVSCVIYEGDESYIDNYKLAADDPVGTSNALTFSQKLNSLYFHSDLNYLGSTQTATTKIVSHPVRTAASASQSKHSGASYAILKGTQEYTLMSHSGTLDTPFIVQENSNQLMQGLPIQSSGASVRAVGAYNDGSSIKIRETYVTHSDSLPAVNKTYTVYMFDIVSNSNVSADNTLKITSTNFTAGAGRLDTDKKYIRREDTNPDFYFSKAKTADVQRGKLKVVAPSGEVIYNPTMPSPQWGYRHNNAQAGGTNYVYHFPDTNPYNTTLISSVFPTNPLYEGSFGGSTSAQGTTVANWASSGNSVGIKI